MAPLAFLSNPDRLILVILVKGRLSDLVLGVFPLNRMREKVFLSLCPEIVTDCSLTSFMMRERFLYFLFSR